MKPNIYYYPENSFQLALNDAKEMGFNYETRTYKTDIGECPCIDVKDYNGNTIYLFIIDDYQYRNADMLECML